MIVVSIALSARLARLSRGQADSVVASAFLPRTGRGASHHALLEQPCGVPSPSRMPRRCSSTAAS